MGTPMALEDRSLTIFVLAAVFMILSLTTVSLRCFVRSYIVRAFGWDDILMLVALALFVILAICCMIGTSNGVGHKFTDFTSMVVYERALLWWWLSQMFYIWASAVAKVSIAVALLRLTVKRVHRIILWVNITLTTVNGLVFWLVLLLDCHPVSYFWTHVYSDSTGSCLSADILLDIAYLYSAITVVCDLTLGILPIFLVWHLQMNRRTKVAVGGILSLGAIASVAVIIRLPFLKYYADSDFLYSTFQIAIWTIIETGLGIIAGSLVTLRPLFRWLLDGSWSFGRKGRIPGRSSGQYHLSSFKSGGAKISQDPSLWRPDTHANDRTVDIMSPPRSKTSNDASSSQEALNPPSSASPRNGVTVQHSFVQTVSEGER